jgi:hypothetical protein
MEVRIGVVHTIRELTLETDEPPETVTAAIDGAVAHGDGLLWLTDSKGRRIGVPVDKIAYVEVKADAGDRRVGFGPS